MYLPVIICSSVIRSTKRGDSHGGIYLIDLEKDIVKQVIDWNDELIDWDGRGGERGLRGIAFYEDMIIIAASNKILFFDQNFKMIKYFSNKYLKSCHERYIKDKFLYLSSTGFDSILI